MAKKNNKSAVQKPRPFILRFFGFWFRLFRFLLTPPGLYFTLVIAVAAVTYWQWTNITSWITDTVNTILNIFGWGLVFVFLAILTIIILAVRHRLSALWYGWRYWLAIVAFIFTIWGVLAFFDLGGNIGMSLIGRPNFLGGLRVVAVAIIGVILLIPDLSWKLTKKAASGIAGQGRKWHKPSPVIEPENAIKTEEEVVPQTAPPPKPPVVSKTGPVKIPKPEKIETATTNAEMSAREDLKQVAQEVWKKYGESPSTQVVDGWKLPPVDILEKSPEIVFNQSDNSRRARLIEEALESYGVEAKVVQINTGPTVTQFGIEPGWDRKMREFKEKDRDGHTRVRQEEISKTRVKVERINSLANDLALALAAPTIRIEAPIPGQSLVGIEVPNTVSTSVTLRGVIETSAFQKMQNKSKLTLALGKGAGGEAVAADLSRMPHLLIAGATGSGKTVCLNTIICSLLLTGTPYDLRFVLIDPKRVELTSFDSIPHLASPVIVEAEKAVEALRWLAQEMDRRYQKLQAAAARSIDGFNKTRQGDQKMPYMVLVIDELADLMMQSGDEVERILCRLAQLARAVGIHLVVATQRPSVDVITGLIKANFPTRISFAVSSQVDSRTILDGAGAEKLLGKGDMLFMPQEASKPKRLQGCFVSDAEIDRLVYFWNSQRRDAPSLKINTAIPSTSAGKTTSTIVDGSLKPNPTEDPLMEDARIIAADHPQFSISYLQRKLRVGYNRAANIAEKLQQEGYGADKPGYGKQNNTENNEDNTDENQYDEDNET
jgi:DNA segregation ATPase FtsK/SpoIIIE, S-DNA-T family